MKVLGANNFKHDWFATSIVCLAFRFALYTANLASSRISLLQHSQPISIIFHLLRLSVHLKPPWQKSGRPKLLRLSVRLWTPRAKRAGTRQL